MGHQDGARGTQARSVGAPEAGPAGRKSTAAPERGLRWGDAEPPGSPPPRLALCRNSFLPEPAQTETPSPSLSSLASPEVGLKGPGSPTTAPPLRDEMRRHVYPPCGASLTPRLLARGGGGGATLREGCLCRRCCQCESPTGSSDEQATLGGWQWEPLQGRPRAQGEPAGASRAQLVLQGVPAPAGTPGRQENQPEAVWLCSYGRRGGRCVLQILASLEGDAEKVGIWK